MRSDMRARIRGGGFTLVELLIVIVIIGILAGIVIPRLDEARARAHFASIVSDFRHLSQLQELYYQRTMAYGDLEDLEFTPSRGVEVNVTEATAAGWAARGTHVGLSGDQGCSIFLGNATAPSLPNGQPHVLAAGVPDCVR